MPTTASAGMAISSIAGTGRAEATSTGGTRARSGGGTSAGVSVDTSTAASACWAVTCCSCVTCGASVRAIVPTGARKRLPVVRVDFGSRVGRHSRVRGCRQLLRRVPRSRRRLTDGRLGPLTRRSSRTSPRGIRRLRRPQHSPWQRRRGRFWESSRSLQWQQGAYRNRSASFLRSPPARQGNQDNRPSPAAHTT